MKTPITIKKSYELKGSIVKIVGK